MPKTSNILSSRLLGAFLGASAMLLGAPQSPPSSSLAGRRCSPHSDRHPGGHARRRRSQTLVEARPERIFGVALGQGFQRRSNSESQISQLAARKSHRRRSQRIHPGLRPRLRPLASGSGARRPRHHRLFPERPAPHARPEGNDATDNEAGNDRHIRSGNQTRQQTYRVIFSKNTLAKPRVE